MAKKRKAGKRRARNEGSVYRRDSDGRWVATLVVGFDKDGKQKRKVFYGWTQEDAVASRDGFRAKLTLGEVQLGADSKQTVGQYLDTWFKALCVKKTTKRRYGQIIDYRIIPYLGGYPLEKLAQRKVGQQIIKLWLAWLREQDAAPHPSREQNGAAVKPAKKITERGRSAPGPKMSGRCGCWTRCWPRRCPARGVEAQATLELHSDGSGTHLGKRQGPQLLAALCHSLSSGGWDRTTDTRLMKPLL